MGVVACLPTVISSCSERAGKLGCTAITFGVAAMSPIGAKSLRGS
jgi:hypothetical protein